MIKEASACAFALQVVFGFDTVVQDLFVDGRNWFEEKQTIIKLSVNGHLLYEGEQFFK